MVYILLNCFASTYFKQTKVWEFWVCVDTVSQLDESCQLLLWNLTLEGGGYCSNVWYSLPQFSFHQLAAFLYFCFFSFLTLTKKLLTYSKANSKCVISSVVFQFISFKDETFKNKSHSTFIALNKIINHSVIPLITHATLNFSCQKYHFNLIYLHLGPGTFLIRKVILVKAFPFCSNKNLPFFSMSQVCCRNEASVCSMPHIFGLACDIRWCCLTHTVPRVSFKLGVGFGSLIKHRFCFGKNISLTLCSSSC